jgi:hypothetical protein
MPTNPNDTPTPTQHITFETEVDDDWADVVPVVTPTNTGVTIVAAPYAEMQVQNMIQAVYADAMVTGTGIAQVTGVTADVWRDREDDTERATPIPLPAYRRNILFDTAPDEDETLIRNKPKVPFKKEFVPGETVVVVKDYVEGCMIGDKVRVDRYPTGSLWERHGHMYIEILLGKNKGAKLDLEQNFFKKRIVRKLPDWF